MVFREGNCGTHAKLDRHGEEVTAGLLGDLITARDTREVDIAGLDEALGAREGLEQLLGESGQENVSMVRKRTTRSKAQSITCNQRKPWTRWPNQHRPWP